MNIKQKRERNRRSKWYGMKKIKKGQKACWLAKQDKNGWALGLNFGERTLWLRNMRISNVEEIERIITANLVFIELKNK